MASVLVGMKSPQIRTPARRLADVADDLAIETLVAIEGAWNRAQ